MKTHTALVATALVLCAAACGGSSKSAAPAEPQAAPAAGSAEPTPVGPDPAAPATAAPATAAPAETATGPTLAPAPAAAPADPAPAAATPPPAEAAASTCVVELVVDATRVRFEGGGLKGAVPLRHIDKLKGALAPAAAAHCRAVISADAHVKHGKVVAIMDQLMAVGIKKIALASGRSAGTPAPAPAPAPTSAGPSKSSLRDDPVVVVSLTDVTVNGTSLHRSPSAGDLAAAVQKALTAGRAKHPGQAIIIQADKRAPQSAVVHVVDAARAAGYQQVLFAVKKK